MGRILYIIWTLFLVLVPIIIWILPVDTINKSTVELCPSKLLLNMECPGCGITRAVVNFHHFEFGEAIYYNWGVLIVYPILAFFWVLFLKELLLELNLPIADKIPVKTFREFEFLKKLSKKI